MRLPVRLAVLVSALLAASISLSQTNALPNVDSLVAAYFDAPDDAVRAEALKAIKDRKDVTIQQVEDAVRRGVWYKPEASGTFTRKITVEFNRQETDCTFYVPPGYDPKKSYPALLVMHGTGGTGEKFLDRWLPYVTKRNMIVIAPTQVSGVDGPSGKPFGKGAGYGAQPLERSTPISAIHAARRTYNIDSDRITMTGCSMGAHCTWDTMIQRTDYFAGGIPEAGIPMVEGFQLARYMSLGNFFQARMWVMQGTPDKDQPGVNQHATDEMKKLGCPVEYRQYEGRGHGTYPEESDKALDFVSAGARDVYCRKVTKITHHAVDGRAYWLRIDKLKDVEWDPRGRVDVHISAETSSTEVLRRALDFVQRHFGRVDGEIKDNNVIELKTRYVSSVTLFLHDKLVDLDKPVTVVINGKSYKKTVKRDVGFMLDEVRRGMDTQRTFYGFLKMNVY